MKQLIQSINEFSIKMSRVAKMTKNYYFFILDIIQTLVMIMTPYKKINLDFSTGECPEKQLTFSVITSKSLPNK